MKTRTIEIQSENFEKWCAELATVLEDPDDDGVPLRLINGIRNLVTFDAAGVCAFHRHKAPSEIFDEMPREPVKYLESPYLLDPIYNKFLDGSLPACCRMRDLLPDDFVNSDYWNTYYKHLRLADEMYLNVAASKRTTIHVMLSRIRPAKQFSRREITFFNAVMPVVASVLRKYWRKHRARLMRSDEQSASFDAHLRDVFAKFGKSTLTRREKQVVLLSMRGFSSKLIAKELEISPGTVRNHKKHIYAKLGVKSQAQIFALFLSALRSPPYDVNDGDPLVRLLSSQS